MKGPRKYLSEFAVNLYTARWLFFPEHQFHAGATLSLEEQEAAANCHIYLIASHPAAYFITDQFNFDGKRVRGEVAYKVKGVESRLSFEFDFPLLDGAVDLVIADYPHRELHTVDGNGGVIRFVPAHLVLVNESMSSNLPGRIGAYEVLYVGQSIGDGTRAALDRLQSHSTLQKILSAISRSEPDNEIYLGLFEYEDYRVITQMNGMATNVIADERDMHRFFSIFENPLTEDQKISLAEAGLIRYFQPKYNEIYKSTFPSAGHKILKECYELDFSGLAVEINTEPLRLFSGTRAASSHHIAQIDLYAPIDRSGFFDLFGGEGDPSDPIIR